MDFQLKINKKVDECNQSQSVVKCFFLKKFGPLQLKIKNTQAHFKDMFLT